MDQRLADYVEYYRARLASLQANATLYPHALAAEQAMFEAISTAPDLATFGERVHGQGLHVACAVGRVRDVHTAEAKFFDERGEVARAAPHHEVLRALDERPPATPQDLVTMVSEILDRWNLRISADEMLRDDLWNDFKILEDIEAYRVAEVPPNWRAERQASAERELGRNREHFERVTLPERRKFVPDWAPDWGPLVESRHRRCFPVADDVLERRIAGHRELLGRS